MSNCTNCSRHMVVKSTQKCTTALPIFLLSIGVVEVIISLTVLSRRSLNKLYLRYSLMVLCTAAFVLLLLGMLRLAFMCHLQFDIRKQSFVFCVTHRLLTDVMVQLSSTTVAFISLERCIAIIYPYMIAQRRARVERVGLCLIVGFSILFNSHYLFTMDKDLEKPIYINVTSYAIAKAATRENYHCHLQKMLDKKIILLMTCIQTYVPLLIILISNICLINRLYVLKRRRIQNQALSAPLLRSKAEGGGNRLKLCNNTTASATAQNSLPNAIESGSKSQAQPIELVVMLVPPTKDIATDQLSSTTSTSLMVSDKNEDVIEVEGGENTLANGNQSISALQEKNYCRSREAKAAQLILFITVSFLAFHMPYECYHLLWTYNMLPKNTLTNDLWHVFLYTTYCYQLLVFPVYIVYHPIIRAQITSWFADAKQLLSKEDLGTCEKQRSKADGH